MDDNVHIEVSVVVPSHNEQGNVVPLLEKFACVRPQAEQSTQNLLVVLAEASRRP